MKLNMPQSSIQVLDRSAQLMDTLAANSTPLSLKILAAETGLHPSTAFRILNALAQHGFVARSEDGNYQLGYKLLQLGAHVRGRVDVQREARPIMEWLRDEIGESINLTVREGDEVVYVDRSLPQRMMRVEQVIGSRAPLHVTAVGKLFLGQMGRKECAAYARRTRLPRFTPNTLTRIGTLWPQAEAALQQGYALDDEEAEIGVGCIGVPLRDGQGAIVAGLSISAPRERRQAEWVGVLQQAGRKISARLGYVEQLKS